MAAETHKVDARHLAILAKIVSERMPQDSATFKAWFWSKADELETDYDWIVSQAAFLLKTKDFC